MDHKYFTTYELLHSQKAVDNHIENIPDWKALENLDRLATLLDTIREKWGKPIKVNSGFRDEKVNALVGGSKTSQHRFGEAADIEDTGGNNKKLFNLIYDMIKNGEIEVGQLIDEYNYDWVHVSLPTEKLHNQIKHLK